MSKKAPKIELKNFKEGDEVIMTESHEATFAENQKSWTCISDSFIDKSGDEVVFLDGFSGLYMCLYLSKVTTNSNA